MTLTVIAWKELVYLSKNPYKLKAKALGMDMTAMYVEELRFCVENCGPVVSRCLLRDGSTIECFTMCACA